MGLLIKSTEAKKIKIKGSEVELQSVYARAEFAGHADGKTLEVAYKTYISEQEYKSESRTPIATDITNSVGGSKHFQLGADEVQSLPVALSKLQNVLIELGYEVITL